MVTATAVGRALIRAATLADVPAILALGARFLQETTYRELIADDPERRLVLTERLIRNAHETVLLAERDGALVGILGLVAYWHHLSGEWVAGEVFWFIDPQARGSLGVRMLIAAEQWARDAGAVAFQMGAPADSPRVAQLYCRRGYAPVETTYQRRLA